MVAAAAIQSDGAEPSTRSTEGGREGGKAQITVAGAEIPLRPSAWFLEETGMLT